MKDQARWTIPPRACIGAPKSPATAPSWRNRSASRTLLLPAALAPISRFRGPTSIVSLRTLR